MNIRTTLIASSLIAASLVSGAAHATLQGRDLNGSVSSAEAYYDTDLNITWLADANYGAGSSFDDIAHGSTTTDGKMTWANANTWAANLSFTNGVNTYDNWRLPAVMQPDASCASQSSGLSYGYNCTGSEMGHLFYSELGGVASQSILTSADPDLAKFTNLQAAFYWASTGYDVAANNAQDVPAYSSKWGFVFSNGSQNSGIILYGSSTAYGSNHYALAVSYGDVGIAAVPEADTWAMLLAGLGLVGVATRRRRG